MAVDSHKEENEKKGTELTIASNQFYSTQVQNATHSYLTCYQWIFEAAGITAARKSHKFTKLLEF